MEQEKDKVSVKSAATWFWKWFLNNKVVTILLVSLLVLLNLLVFSKITYLFNPIKGFFSVIGLPILMAGILFYLFNPLIDWMEKENPTYSWNRDCLYDHYWFGCVGDYHSNSNHT